MNKLQNELEYIKVRNKVYFELESLVTKRGYIKIEPDFFEPYDWFLKTNTRIDPKSMVKLIDPSGEVQLLRPDITTNIMKQLSPYWEGNSTFKLFYNATTFRQTENRITQSRQFGIEYIGDASYDSEIEIVQLVTSIFKRFSPNFILSIGNQKLLEDILSVFDLDKQKEIKKAIAKRDETSFLQLIGNTEDQLLQNLFSLNGSIEDVIKKLNTFRKTDLVLKYKEFLGSLENKLTADQLNLIDADLALVPEFDYYSGIVLQGYLRNVSTPILSGGRYDKLTKQYGVEIPAVGVSFDLSSYIKEVNNE